MATVTGSIHAPSLPSRFGFIYICMQVTNVSLLVSQCVCFWLTSACFSQEKGPTAKTVKVRKTYDFAGDEVV